MAPSSLEAMPACARVRVRVHNRGGSGEVTVQARTWNLKSWNGIWNPSLSKFHEHDVEIPRFRRQNYKSVESGI